MTAPQPDRTLIDAAREWYDAGYCVVPSHHDKSKRPHNSWLQYQTVRPTWHELEQWLETGQYDGIGVICGQVSGNAEMLEIEGHAVAAGAMERLLAAATEYECEDLFRRVFTGCSGRSAGAGLHMHIKVTDEPALPNTRLAFDQQSKILAETRGEGGFAIVAPTPGRTGHEAGSKYEFLARGPAHVATVTGEERDLLHMLLTIALDDRPEPSTPAYTPNLTAPSPSGDTPGDSYNEQTAWDDILIPAGWSKVHTGQRDGNPLIYWRRPGKDHGISATTGGPGDHLYVFSSSTLLPAEQPLSKFAVYTYLTHGGDFRAAAKELAKEGHGTPLPSLGTFDWSVGPSETPEGPGSTFSDLSWVLTGERHPPEPPVYLATDSGGYLFYAGRINGLFGDPETAKSWIAQTAIAQALTLKHKCVYLDIDHNGAPEIAERLLLLGAPPAVIADPNLFRIYEPEDKTGLQNFIHEMTQWEPKVAVIDSLGELIPMLGLKSIDNDELTLAIRAVLKPLAHKIGACVITIDHLPKGQDARGNGYAIGGIAKKRAIDGSYLSCDAINPPAPGQIGKIRLTIEKDRHGQVRAHATGKIAGDYILDSTDPAFANTRIEQPEQATDGKIKPTSAMRAVTQYLMDLDEWTAPSRNTIQTHLAQTSSYKKHTIDRAIEELAAEHYIIIQSNGPGKASSVKLTKPYQEHGLTDATGLLQ